MRARALDGSGEPVSEPLESAARDAHLANATLKLRCDPAHGGVIAFPPEECKALLAELERLRDIEIEWGNDALWEEVLRLRARPTGEQALDAMECWAAHQTGVGEHVKHASILDCLDAAMRVAP